MNDHLKRFTYAYSKNRILQTLKVKTQKISIQIISDSLANAKYVKSQKYECIINGFFNRRSVIQIPQPAF